MGVVVLSWWWSHEFYCCVIHVKVIAIIRAVDAFMHSRRCGSHLLKGSSITNSHELILKCATDKNGSQVFDVGLLF